MHPGVFFMHLRHMLPWWSPAIIAWYGTLFMWAREYPQRYYEDIPASDGSVEVFSRWFGMFFWALVMFYAMWFALPYPGVEILVDLCCIPVMLIVFGMLAIGWVVHLIDEFGSYQADEHLEKGLTCAEWEQFKRRREFRDFQLRVNAMYEAIEPERRKQRFIVFEGKRGKKRGDRA
ncbi:hypothetical protein [Alicyclobacillus acidocaldarius]|uniref:Transmembrane protein n=1 Tax=Alicyclobacillus acidocaldarius subsp. acidocaldarius (strain ATCC 27009 / DSM 446 / BCRC 14685 / JCM 5260 / KCTC 1825 / NBRC 15652 / NCIMB 11725 / NRRL B-14509 / 104-IA) TaxID=521098 RepID=C8WY80_ALIAD|nr:hypothetical protein [Alicyclobacillus acidocaldarius]ACV59974.1 hypothetical protein Aaci_2971 [Alicyclobacillus acidocaldarius subsp. acidocaldarius DSM 446]